MNNASIDPQNLKELATTIRVLSAEAVQRANSGHPGLPLGAADFAAVLWSKYLKFDPASPAWKGRDHFILSAGHGSALLYSLLHLFGYGVSTSDLKEFRQWDSITPGHPEFGMTPGVECTTGPLGQGFANGVGVGLSLKMLGAKYSKELFSGKVYALVSDGDLMEGVAAEAASLAGHLKLGNLVYLYDDNDISLADPTSVCFSESVQERFKSYGWHVQSCDGHDYAAINSAIQAATDESDRPSIICMKTTIGFGSPKKAGTSGVHGSPLGEDELQAFKENVGAGGLEPFAVPESVQQLCAQVVESNKKEREEWESAFAKWKDANKDLDEKLTAQFSKELPSSLKQELLAEFEDAKKEATRNLSGQALQVIARNVPGFVGGSADLEPSTKTLIKDEGDCSAEDYAARNIRFGVREHAMGSMVNGFAYAGGWIPYASTFLVFSDYLRPTLRIAGLSHLQSLFIFTHDSFWVGEDGPTHEPIEHVQSLRLIPGVHVFRPADGMEVAMCYYKALELKEAPSALVFTRQGVEPLSRPEGFDPDSILNGAYVVQGEDVEDLVLVATGSEVALAVSAAALLSEGGIQARVVSMPCQELFLKLSEDQRNKIIPPSARKVSLEAGVTCGWQRIVGEGLCLGIDHYGASAPGEVLAEKFGFTPQKVAEKIVAWMGDS